MITQIKKSVLFRRLPSSHISELNKCSRFLKSPTFHFLIQTSTIFSWKLPGCGQDHSDKHSTVFLGKDQNQTCRDLYISINTYFYWRYKLKCQLVLSQCKPKMRTSDFKIKTERLSTKKYQSPKPQSTQINFYLLHHTQLSCCLTPLFGRRAIGNLSRGVCSRKRERRWIKLLDSHFGNNLTNDFPWKSCDVEIIGHRRE